MARLQKIRRTTLAESAANHPPDDSAAATASAPNVSPESFDVPASSIRQYQRATKGFSRLPRRLDRRSGQRRRRLTELRAAAPESEVSIAAAEPPADRLTDEVAASAQQPQKIDSAAAGGIEPAFVVQTLPESAPEPYAAWFRRVVVRNRWMTYFTAFYLHWLALLLMALLIVHGPEQTAGLLLNATVATEREPEPPTFEVVAPMPLPEADQSEEATAEETDPIERDLPEPDVRLSDRLLDKLANAASASRPPVSSKSPAMTSAAAPTQSFAPDDAVSEGSFSVWTEPAYPVAGEPYRIVIQIRLPDDVRKYNLKDLQGVVVGSDGYRKPIPGGLRGELPIDSGYVRLVVPIVSADEQVRDTVLIRSKLLKESQKLVLQF